MNDLWNHAAEIVGWNDDSTNSRFNNAPYVKEERNIKKEHKQKENTEAEN